MRISFFLFFLCFCFAARFWFATIWPYAFFWCNFPLRITSKIEKRNSHSWEVDSNRPVCAFIIAFIHFSSFFSCKDRIKRKCFMSLFCYFSYIFYVFRTNNSLVCVRLCVMPSTISALPPPLLLLPSFKIVSLKSYNTFTNIILNAISFSRKRKEWNYCIVCVQFECREKEWTKSFL